MVCGHPGRPPRDIYHPPGAAGKNGGSSSTGNGPNASVNEGRTGEGKRHREKRPSDGGTGRGNARGGTENSDERSMFPALVQRTAHETTPNFAEFSMA
jgi:hypothetical protein